MDIVDNILIGDKRAIAQSISKIDDENPQSHELLKRYIQNRKSCYNWIYGSGWCR